MVEQIGRQGFAERSSGWPGPSAASVRSRPPSYHWHFCLYRRTTDSIDALCRAFAELLVDACISDQNEAIVESTSDAARRDPALAHRRRGYHRGVKRFVGDPATDGQARHVN